MILESLAACRSNFSLAASQLGLGRTTLYRKLKKYGIQRSWKPDWRASASAVDRLANAWASMTKTMLRSQCSLSARFALM